MAGTPEKTLRLKVEAQVQEARKKIEELQKDLQKVGGVNTTDQTAVVERVAKQYNGVVRDSARLARNQRAIRQETEGQSRSLSVIRKAQLGQLGISQKLELTQKRISHTYGDVEGRINKIVAAFRKQGNIQDVLLRAEQGHEKVLKNRLASQARLNRLIERRASSMDLVDAKKSVEIWKQREGIASSVLKRIRQINAEESRTRSRQERYGASYETSYQAGQARRRAINARLAREQAKKRADQERYGASYEASYQAGQARRRAINARLAREQAKKRADQERYGASYEASYQAGQAKIRSINARLAKERERQVTESRNWNRMVDRARREMQQEFSRRRLVSSIGAITSDREQRAAAMRMGAGEGYQSVVGGINRVRRFSRLTGRNSVFDAAIGGATSRRDQALAREERTLARIRRAEASGDQQKLSRLNAVLRAQKAGTSLLQAELELTKKTVAERTKFLRQSWLQRASQSEGRLGNAVRGGQMVYGHVAGVYQKTSNAVGGFMRVYWSFLSIFYLLRNALQIAIAPVGMLVRGFRAVVGAVMKAAQEMITVAGQTESLEQRLTSFEGISPGIKNWVVGQALGKPFEWTQIGEAVQRGMAMGAPSEDYTKNTLMPAAYDLAASFMSEENQGTILRDAVMAMMQGAAGNFSRLIRSFGFRPETALQFGAAPGQGGRGVSGDPKHLQQNLTAIIAMVQSRVGNTSEALSNTLLALHSDMEDIRKNIGAAFADTGLFNSLKVFMMSLRSTFTKLWDSGKIKQWMDALSTSFNGLVPVIYEVLPFVFVSLRTVMELIGKMAENLSGLFGEDALGTVGEKVNLVISTIQVVLEGFFDTMKQSLPSLGKLFLDWIKVSISATSMVLDAMLWVGGVFTKGLKKIVWGEGDERLREIEKFIWGTRGELFKKGGLMDIAGTGVNNLHGALTGTNSGMSSAVDTQMKENAALAANFPSLADTEKLLTQSTKKGTYLGTKQAIDEETGGDVGDAGIGGGGGMGTGSAIGGVQPYSMVGNNGGFTIGGGGGGTAPDLRGYTKQLQSKYGPAYDAVQGASSGDLYATRGQLESAHAASLQRRASLFASLQATKDKEAIKATKEKIRAEDQYAQAIAATMRVIDQRSKKLESEQKKAAKALYPRGGANAGDYDDAFGALAGMAAGPAAAQMHPAVSEAYNVAYAAAFNEAYRAEKQRIELERMQDQAERQGMVLEYRGDRWGIYPKTGPARVPFSGPRAQVIPHAGPSSGVATAGSGNVKPAGSSSILGALPTRRVTPGAVAGVLATSLGVGYAVSRLPESKRSVVRRYVESARSSLRQTDEAIDQLKRGGRDGLSAFDRNVQIERLERRRANIIRIAKDNGMLNEVAGWTGGAGREPTIEILSGGGGDVSRGASRAARTPGFWNVPSAVRNLYNVRAAKWAENHPGRALMWGGAKNIGSRAWGGVKRGGRASWDVVKRLPWPFIKRLGGYAAAASIPYDVLMGLLEASPVDAADNASYDTSMARRQRNARAVRESEYLHPNVGAIINGSATSSPAGGVKIGFSIPELDLSPALSNRDSVFNHAFEASGY